VVDNGQIFPVLDKIGGMGFNWFKQQIEWKRFEGAGPGQIDWGAMDEIVQQLRQPRCECALQHRQGAGLGARAGF
jgi:hypothetical protein